MKAMIQRVSQASVQIDGYGYQGFEVDYGSEWDEGADMMADKLLSRMRLGSLLPNHTHIFGLLPNCFEL